MIVRKRRDNIVHHGVEVLGCLATAHAGPQSSYYVQPDRTTTAMRHPPLIRPEGIERYPQIVMEPGHCSDNSLRRHADHRHRMPGDLDRLAHNRPIFGITRLPKRITQDHVGNGWTRLFFSQKETPQHRLDAEHVEIVRRHVRNIDTLGLCAARQRDPIVMICEYSGEGVVLLAQIAIVEIREGRSRREVPFPPLQAHKIARVPRAWNRTQHCAVDPTEYGAVGANSYGQHRRRGDREAGALTQLPQRITDVPAYLFKPASAPHLARHILHKGNVSKLPHCRLSRRLCRLASRHPICNRHLQVSIDLFLQFAVSPLKTEARKPLHDSLSPGLTYITDPIASTIRSHRPRSLANCFFPLAVIR